LQAVADARPGFVPRLILDAGAGPGTATWAAAQLWDSVESAVLIEASPVVRGVGERLSRELPLDHATWRTGRLDAGLADVAPRDLVLLAYVLGELPSAAREPVIALLWQLTADVLVIVEPGTTEGWKRILQARDVLISAGAHLLAPCPHAHACPLAAPDWCHFSARVTRSRLHREAKGGTVPWEDEKFIYIAVSRHGAATQRSARVLAPPNATKASITLKLCRPDGTAVRLRIERGEGEAFKGARRLTWGDVLPPDL
jgi:ribosomal protein RSM22 (predicted rRNA methylase)